MAWPDAENCDLETLACRIANDWWRVRRDIEIRELDSRSPLSQRLDALERLTRGNVLRCDCIAGRDSHFTVHDMQCGAFKP